jgi:SAM-dependent methyltransferase
MEAHPQAGNVNGMNLNLEECSAADNHLWLIEEFVTVLAAYQPKSVLDVGCGAGMLLKTCKARGMNVSGVDQPGPRLAELKADGFYVQEGSAYELPMEPGSVDWITLRHVPHHLKDPARAFRELLRVARCGVLLAEPTYDARVPSQQCSGRADSWEKRQHRRGGMYHAESYDLAGLLDLMPEGYETEFSIEVRETLRLRSASLEDFRRRADSLTAELPSDDPECTAKEALLAEAGETGLSWNGSLLLTLVRR